MSTVISVENLSKKYIIGHQKQERYTALRDVLADGAKRLTHKLIHPFYAPVNDPTHEEFWALKDVSFDIQQGDRVGIIGRNGAGKSTLLKILSRITEPTAGMVSIKGRVASLLEVGTGFHPELSGRENIFLNGAILGMNKLEIKSKFDEIVAFAEVEKFLDTPVKRYSSGMYVRLAFAVAAHLEPEILIVDEVLAVGDAQFQKKCMGKIEQVGNEGRTVVLVSHNMNVLNRLCQRAVLLSEGQVVTQGPAKDIIEHYLGNSTNKQETELVFCEDSSKPFQILAVSLYDTAHDVIYRQMETDEAITVQITYKISQNLPGAYAGFDIRNSYDEVIFMSDIQDIDGQSNELEKPGKKTVSITLPSPLLLPGSYTVTAAICQQGVGVLDLCKNVLSFEIVNTRSARSSWAGYVHIPLQWKFSP